MKYICQECENEFETTDKGRKYCNIKCYGAYTKKYPNKGSFFGGHSPWNKNLKGIHLSPASEFKQGQKGRNWVPTSSSVIRKHKGDGFRVWVKVAEPNDWQTRAIVVWEMKNGPVPKGKIIHHIDRNSLNDRPSNLQALTRAEHLTEHRSEFKKAA